MRVLFSILLVLIVFSCTKKEMIHVSAINPVTGVPYAGLRFTITEEKTGTQEIFTKVYDSNLNENGEALFEFKIRKNRSYKLNIETPANNCYKEPANKTFAIQDASFDFKFELVPCSFLKLKINNMNCSGIGDEIVFNRIWLTKNDIPTPVTQIGCFNLDSDFFDLPIGDYKYEWDVTKNGITTHYDSLFTLTENQYYTFSIEY